MKFTVELVVQSLPEMHAERLLEFVSKQITESHHVEFYLSWSVQLLTIHAPKDNVFKQQSLLSIQDSLTRKYDVLSKVCDFNKYTLKVLIEMGDESTADALQKGEAHIGSETDEDDDDDDDTDIDEDNLFLIRKDGNGTNDSDIEMQTQSEDSSSESAD